jgi:hypothetical protein
MFRVVGTSIKISKSNTALVSTSRKISIKPVRTQVTQSIKRTNLIEQKKYGLVSPQIFANKTNFVSIRKYTTGSTTYKDDVSSSKVF